MSKFSSMLDLAIEETIRIPTGLVRESVLAVARAGVDGMGIGELGSKLCVGDVHRYVECAVGDGRLVFSASRTRVRLPRATFAAIINRRRQLGGVFGFEADVAALLEGEG